MVGGKTHSKTFMYKITRTEGLYTYTQAETINVQLNTQTRMKDTTNTLPVCYGG